MQPAVAEVDEPPQSPLADLVELPQRSPKPLPDPNGWSVCSADFYRAVGWGVGSCFMCGAVTLGVVGFLGGRLETAHHQVCGEDWELED